MNDQEIQRKATLQRLAIPQAVLALMALSVYHVQIITRLSSGYPLWYIWLAVTLSRVAQRGPRKLGRTKETCRTIIRFMAGYAVIQGGLFACFLPPA